MGARAANINEISNLVFQVGAITDQLASHVLCLYFRRNGSHFFVSRYQLEVIAPHESGFFPMIKAPFSANEICELIQKLYESRGEYLHPYIRGFGKGSDDILMPIFFDLSGRLYATPRSVYLSDLGEFHYGKSDLLQPEYFAHRFAPPFESTEQRKNGSLKH